jgi:hypothetical protein
VQGLCSRSPTVSGRIVPVLIGNGSVEPPVSCARDESRVGGCSMGGDSVARCRQMFAASKEVVALSRVYPRPLGQVGAELSRGPSRRRFEK